MPNLKLVVSIINFLKDEGNKPETCADTKESLEVAVQCLQTAFDIENKDCESPENKLPFSLEECFQSVYLSFQDDSAQKIRQAEVMKNLGNNLMKSNQFMEAIKFYTSAIELDNMNAIYYGNRAAAYSKINDFPRAIKDCEKAIEIDPRYAKAYGRMGLAYASLDKHEDAIKAFKQAVKLDPTNESYQSNLQIALEKRDKQPSNPGGLSGLNNVDWQTLFNNPAFQNMASSLLQDPNIINALSRTMASASNSTGAGSSSNSSNSSSGGAGGSSGNNPTDTATASNASGNRLDVLLEAGQYLAAQMQAANPDLVEQFRQTTSRAFRENPDNKDSTQ